VNPAWEAIQLACSPAKRLRVKQVLDQAELLGVDRSTAVSMRLSYLFAEKMEIDEAIDWLVEHESGDDEVEWMLADVTIRLIERRNRLMREERAMRGYNKPQPANQITDEMIAQARAYPVEQLVDFTKGKAMAWCHEDKRPSLSWWKKGNSCTCFVCGKRFNPIDIMVERDNMSFVNAVKYLNGVT